MSRPVVHLVGAGPGDPGLLTVRAAQLLGSADVVFHDELVSSEILDTIRRGAEVVSVGHRAGWPKHPVEMVAKWMAQRARSGQVVVRLKGGDPYVFGRGGEEALALRAEGVDFETVPGVSSAIAGPAGAGIPVTHRGLATSVCIVTAHDVGRPGQHVRWQALADLGGTLVVLMGAARLQDVAGKLQAAGMPPSTPAAVIIRATTPAQRTVVGSLQSVAGAGLTQAESPALLVLGHVVALAAELGESPERSLEPLAQVLRGA